MQAALERIALRLGATHIVLSWHKHYIHSLSVGGECFTSQLPKYEANNLCESVEPAARQLYTQG